MCRDGRLFGSVSFAAQLSLAVRRPLRAPIERGAVVHDEGQHETCVDAWLERSAKDLSPPVLWRLFTEAFGKLWAETKTALGEVTLAAITERVLHNASERFPFLSALKAEANGASQFELDERVQSADVVELRRGIRFVLTEFLTVLGNLTGEILTPELHAALSNVALAEPVHGDGKAPGFPLADEIARARAKRP